MITILTALELAGNYPDNILIESYQEKGGLGLFGVFCYLKRDGIIHKTMLSSSPYFNTSEEAENYIHEIAKWCVERYGKLKPTE